MVSPGVPQAFERVSSVARGSQWLGVVAAAHRNPRLRSSPLYSGMVRVSGETVEGTRPCDAFHTFVDDQGDVVVVLLDLQGKVQATQNFLTSLLQRARVLLGTHEPLHQIVNELELTLAAMPGLEAGLVILRVSQRDAKIELLNAGMPPLAQARLGGALRLHPPLSNPLGRRVGEVHPYELLPLSAGDAWLALSSGMTGGALDPERVRELCAQLDFTEAGVSLAATGADALHDVLRALLSAERVRPSDATCVFVALDAQGTGDNGRSRAGSETH